MPKQNDGNMSNVLVKDYLRILVSNHQHYVGFMDKVRGLVNK